MSFYDLFFASTIYHATASVLKRLDRTQDSFLRELGIDKTAILMDFNLAPLSMRRGIALLGMLHRPPLAMVWLNSVACLSGDTAA